VCPLVQGLDIVPDVPHAADNSGRKTEGSGVGIFKEPPVKGAEFSLSADHGGGRMHYTAAASNSVSRHTICVNIEGHKVRWETLLIGKALFVEIPNDILPEGSRMSFVSLLEIAEEKLGCSRVIVCFKKNRRDRDKLIQAFKFLGFVLSAPGTQQTLTSSDLIYLAYSVNTPESSDTEDESDFSD
jgi:hypothetical protein